jgi:hypothetical protein
MSFGLLTFGIVLLYTTKQYKVKSNYKRASNRYKYRTGFSRLRASSLANSRPPFAQICVINLLPMLRAILGISTKSDADRLKFGLFKIFACVQPVAEPPKLLGLHAPVLVSKTSDGYACAPDNLTGSVRVSQRPRINHLQPEPRD